MLKSRKVVGVRNYHTCTLDNSTQQHTEYNTEQELHVHTLSAALECLPTCGGAGDPSIAASLCISFSWSHLHTAHSSTCSAASQEKRCLSLAIKLISSNGLGLTICILPPCAPVISASPATRAIKGPDDMSLLTHVPVLRRYFRRISKIAAFQHSGTCDAASVSSAHL